MYKRLIVFTFIIIFLFSLVITSFAHSGRTDSNGGHYDRSSGTYHYHCGGHPEHQHPNGVCPYSNSFDEEENIAEVIQMWIFGIVVGIVIILITVNLILGKIKDDRFDRIRSEAVKQQEEAQKYKQLYSESMNRSNSKLEDEIAAMKANYNMVVSEKNSIKRDYLNDLDHIKAVELENKELKKQNKELLKNQSNKTAELSNAEFTKLLVPKESLFFSPQYPIDSYLESIYSGRLYNATQTDLCIKGRINVSATIDSGSDSYNTTLSSCTCPDFRSRRIPCKHMIYLSKNIGTLYIDRDNSIEKMSRKMDELNLYISQTKPKRKKKKPSQSKINPEDIDINEDIYYYDDEQDEFI
ncbi:MAG: YHYH domain-containing protein [Clostridia bacterium]|nr:YHYH domain-containing protein [Clostridia bacterium]